MNFDKTTVLFKCYLQLASASYPHLLRVFFLSFLAKEI
jgi:hypothetical protein